MEFYHIQNLLMNKRNIILNVLFVFIFNEINSQDSAYSFIDHLNFKGQFSSIIQYNPSNDLPFYNGNRYIPQLNVEFDYSKNQLIDFEASANAYLNGSLEFFDSADYNSKIKPYRLWIRYSNPQFELRAGLQKINFGSATILRPLMWFDQMDPRDPLQLTDGVYGLLARYYFLNNANVWLWLLYGNENVKGWEYIPANKNRPEFGGRLQYPVFTGELAISYHNREVEYSQLDTLNPMHLLENSEENKIGIDGKWDIGIGLWFETVFKYQDVPKDFIPWQQQFNVGLDYTFGIGNGLSLITEFLWAGASDQAFYFKDGISFSAITLNYPIGLFDNVTGIIYYNWKDNDWYRFINWQRTYDRISLYLMLFWNPEAFNIYQNLEQTNLFAGKGIQFMFVFNH